MGTGTAQTPTRRRWAGLGGFAMWLAAVSTIVAGTAASLPRGGEVDAGTTRRVVVADGVDGPWQDPATTPWVALGVTKRQPVYFDALGRLMEGREYHHRYDAGPPTGDLADSVAAARSEAARLLRAEPSGEVHLGPGTGSSGGLLAVLALIGSSGTADPAGCSRPQGCLRVAATGEVTGSDADADLVHPIGGLDAKVAAARDAGVDVVFHPAQNLDRPHTVPFAEPWEFARQGAGWDGGTAVVAVWTVRDALAWLCGAAGDDATCTLAGVPRR